MNYVISLMACAPCLPATLGMTSLPKLLASPMTRLYAFLEMRLVTALYTTSAVLKYSNKYG